MGAFLFFSASAFLNLAHESLVNPVGMYSYRAVVEDDVVHVHDGDELCLCDAVVGDEPSRNALGDDPAAITAAATKEDDRMMGRV